MKSAFCTDNGCRKVDNTVVYIPKEGLQRSPEEASKDKTPVQRMESKPKGLCECVSVCVCVGVFVSPFVSLGMLSKRSHRLYLLICDSLFKDH